MNYKIIKYRWWIIAASLLLTVGFSMSLLKLEIDPDLKNYFPKTMTSMVNTERIEEVFGNQDMIMMIFEAEDILTEATLKRVKAVERSIGRMDGIKRTASLFGSNHIYGEEGVMYVEPTVLRIPRNEVQREELRHTIKGNDLVYNVMVSDDFKATALVITLEEDADEDAVFAGIHAVIQEHPGNEKIHFGGLPYLRQAIDKDIKRDGLILIPIALVMMLIFLFLVFREWRGVWLPFLVVVMSALVGLSMIPILGWKFYIITLLVPILLIAVANDYGIHMIARYQELNASGSNESMQEKAARITRDLWKPILLTGLTTIAGISALWAHTMIPARQMALVASIGILLAIFFSLVLLPALLSLLPKSRHVPTLSGADGLNRRNLLGRFSFFVVRNRRIIPVVALAATLAISSGIFFLKVDSNEENFFPERHEVKQAANIINSKFGGSESISVLFTGDMLDPGLLQRMESYGEEMEKLDAIDFTMGFSGVVREISKALNDPGDILYDRIPPSREAVAQYMELYSMNGDPEELEQLVDFNYEHAHLMIRINETSVETVNGIIKRLEEITKGDPAVEVIGGYGYVRTELANKVLTGTYYSLGIALFIIFILLSIIFRSLKAGLLGIIPLSISVVVLFGLMGLTGIRLDVATALLSSVMIGVGVDYSIHFLWRYREERRQNRPATEAVITTITTTGRGIIFNALSVIVGFVVLIISSFTPIRFFGVLVLVSILSCLVGALVILPAIVLRFRFKFLEPSTTEVKIHKIKGKRAMRRVAMGILLALLVAISASAQDAREIVKRSHDVVKVSSFEAVSTLTITDSKGNQRIRRSSMASMLLTDGTEKRIIKFISPAEVRGTGILIFDYPEKSDDMWIYLPALRKTRRIVSREKSKSFMGSEFSNANMTAPGLDDFSYSLLGKETINGKSCYQVVSTPVNIDLEDEYGYSRSVAWVDENNYLVYQIHYFDFDGELFKAITNSEFRELDRERGRYMVTRMKAINHQNKRSSEMVMDQVAVTTTNASYFTVAYLEKE
ncbi:MAG: outer membrane lipoprotein-sorting protein [Bacteroidales bacterium]|nr:outer membrane lipoprotein-sorting protein [Bacteroidales bacterium]